MLFSPKVCTPIQRVDIRSNSFESQSVSQVKLNIVWGHLLQVYWSLSPHIQAHMSRGKASYNSKYTAESENFADRKQEIDSCHTICIDSLLDRFKWLIYTIALDRMTKNSCLDPNHSGLWKLKQTWTGFLHL